MPPIKHLVSDVYHRPRAIRTTIVLSVVVLAGLMLGHVVSATPSSASIGWRGDFETGNFDQWTYGVQEATPSRATVVTSVDGGSPRQGQYAARFEVDSGDNNVGGSGSGERDEALIPTSLTGAGEGVEQWWAWSTYFPSSFVTGNGMWNFFTQFHHTGESGQSNIEFSVKDNSSLVMITNSGDPNNPTESIYNLGPLSKGHWADFVFHVKWSSNASAGFVQVFRDGSQVVPQTSTATIYPGQLVYLKQGFYRGACSCTTVVYDDGMRRGTSYGDVVADFPAGTWPSSPGGSVQPPPPPTTTTTAPAPPAPTTTTTPPAPKTTTSTTTTTAPSKTTNTPTTGGTTTTAGGSSSGGGKAPAVKSTQGKGSVVWDGRHYGSPGTLRTLLAHESGTSWEAFLELHPSAAKSLGLEQVRYGSVFYTRQALSRWLAGHGQSYRGWAKNHPNAAARLASQPADTRVSDRLSLRAHSTRAPRTIEIHAHAFPGATGQLSISSGRTSLYAAKVVVDETGRIDARLTLKSLRGRKSVRVALTADYPEGARTKSVHVKLTHAGRVTASR